MSDKRHLDWQGLYNARDLGGLPTADGGETQWSAVIRSDNLERLTDAGWQALWEYGVRTVIDLRGTDEAAKYPYELGIEGLNYKNMPLEHFYPHVGEMIRNAKTRGEVYCIVLDHYADLVAAVLREIGNAEGGVVIHCHAGKDRTGTISALLLALVGVPNEAITADYAESQARLWPLYEKIVAEKGGEENVGFWLKPTVTTEMMFLLLARLEDKYGGVEAYLREAGMGDEEIKRLKEKLIV